MTAAATTHRFEAEVQELLGLVIHSLYTEREIFLRELISNASDALDKRRIEGLTDETVAFGDAEAVIRLEPDPEKNTLSILDNGIGMSREEMVQNLGTLARSGTRAFLERLKDAGKDEAASLIGRFGVGFYASFMVADEVSVVSRRAGTDEASRWTSKADGTFTVEDATRDTPGTTVTLHLKPKDADDDDFEDFTDTHVLERIVRRHSDFVEHPIQMDVDRWSIERDDEGKPVEGGERKRITETKTLNARTPLWARPKSEVTDEALKDFYRHVTRAFDEPLESIQVAADVPVEIKALLFIPGQAPASWQDRPERASELSLYVRRVLIMPACEDLLPTWLRFVRGVVSSDDLPLNVSRQTLQAHPVVRRIRKMLTGKVLSALEKMRDDDRPRYETFWTTFGPLLKEAIYAGEDDDGRVARLILVKSSAREDWHTLDEHVDKLPEGQDQLLWLSGAEVETLARSPHLEAARKAGRDVLLLGDPIDEWVVNRLREWNDKPFQSLAQGEAPVESDEAKAKRKEREEAEGDFLGAVAKALEGEVAGVHLSSRLAESPAVLVAEEGAPGPTMERMLKQMGHGMPMPRRTLELNPDHPITVRLRTLAQEAPEGEALKDLSLLLLEQARLAEGHAPEDPVGFAARLARVLAASGGPSVVAE